MATINLKDYFYWYINDEWIEVSEDVAAELRANRRSERVHWQRMKRNNSNCSIDAESAIERFVCYGEPTPEELLERAELFFNLWNALNSLPDVQGRRVDAHFILGMSYREIAKAEGVDKAAVRRSVLLGVKNMKEYFRKI